MDCAEQKSKQKRYDREDKMSVVDELIRRKGH